jgi:hypothetical protein
MRWPCRDHRATWVTISWWAIVASTTLALAHWAATAGRESLGPWWAGLLWWTAPGVLAPLASSGPAFVGARRRLVAGYWVGVTVGLVSFVYAVEPLLPVAWSAIKGTGHDLLGKWLMAGSFPQAHALAGFTAALGATLVGRPRSWVTAWSTSVGLGLVAWQRFALQTSSAREWPAWVASMAGALLAGALWAAAGRALREFRRAWPGLPGRLPRRLVRTMAHR